MKSSSSFSPSPYRKKNKVLDVGMGSIWLFGILLIGVSFYTTQKLPSSIKVQITNTTKLFRHGSGNLGAPTVTILSAPKPFTASVGETPVTTIRSWIDLSPNVSVVLFSRDASVASFAADFASCISVETDVDFT